MSLIWIREGYILILLMLYELGTFHLLDWKNNRHFEDL